MPYTLKISDAKLTNDAGEVDVYFDVYLNDVYQSTTALHFTSVPSPSDIATSSDVADLLDRLNSTSDLDSRLAALHLAKGTEVAPVGNPGSVSISKFQFRSLFTLDELVAIDNYFSNPNLDDQTKAIINTILANFAAASEITLSDGATQQGIGFLVQAGLITADRATQILTNTKPA